MTGPAPATVVSLPPEDVVELVEMLEFIAEWFTETRDELADDLTRFADRLGRTP